MRKKVLVISSFILILGFAYISFYLNQYSIEEEENAIHEGLIEWQNRGSDTNFEFEILDITQIDQTNSHIVLFKTANENVGYAQLLKGWNGKYKIEQSGWGTNVAKYIDINTNGGTYGLLIGKNPELKIDHITAESVNKEFGFTSTVSGAKTFVRYKKLPNNLKETFLADLTLYDEENEVISPLREEE